MSHSTDMLHWGSMYLEEMRVVHIFSLGRFSLQWLAQCFKKVKKLLDSGLGFIELSEDLWSCEQ